MTNPIVSGNAPYFLPESTANPSVSNTTIRLLDSICHTLPINYYPVWDAALRATVLIQEIGLFLSLKESYKISFTNKVFSKALLDPNFIARRYKSWQTRGQLSSDQFIEAATKAGKCLSHINLSLNLNEVMDNFPITATTLTKLVTCCPHLKVVSLSGCEKIGLNTILAAFEKCIAPSIFGSQWP